MTSPSSFWVSSSPSSPCLPSWLTLPSWKWGRPGEMDVRKRWHHHGLGFHVHAFWSVCVIFPPESVRKNSFFWPFLSNYAPPVHIALASPPPWHTPSSRQKLPLTARGRKDPVWGGLIVIPLNSLHQFDGAISCAWFQLLRPAPPPLLARTPAPDVRSHLQTSPAPATISPWHFPPSSSGREVNHGRVPGPYLCRWSWLQPLSCPHRWRGGPWSGAPPGAGACVGAHVGERVGARV